MIEVLLVGLMLGFLHALDSDHLAAMASLIARERAPACMLNHGAWWGAGHALTLLSVTRAALLFGRAIPAHYSSWIEGAVGLMLIGLGLHLIHRLRREGVHLHAHRHDGIGDHIHLHSHIRDRAATGSADHARTPHGHDHAAFISLRALLVGMTHGLAGSAALLVLIVAAMKDVWGGLAYVGLFSLGSILGMLGLSAILSLPLSLAARRYKRAHRLGQMAIAGATILVGGGLVLRLGP